MVFHISRVLRFIYNFFCDKFLVLVVHFRRSYFITVLGIGMFTWDKFCIFVFLHPILFVTRKY